MAAKTGEITPGIFVGPLHHGKGSARKTAKNLFRLLSSLGVRNTDVGKVFVEPEEGLAFIQLRSKEAEDFIVRVCKDVRDVLNFFDLRLLTTNPKQFKVIRRTSARNHQKREVSILLTKLEKMTSEASGPSATGKTGDHGEQADQPASYTSIIINSPDRPGVETMDKPVQCQLASDAATTRTWTKSFTETASSPSSSFQQEFEKLEEEENTPLPVMLHASTSMSESSPDAAAKGLPGGAGVDAGAGGGGGGGGEDDPVIKVDVKTSTPHVSPCFCPETVFYHRREHVGSENRHAEFKRGGNLADLRAFRSVVGKYMCAFLNTEGGTIYFGVTDDGRAVGIKACQKTEDMIRLTIDNAVTMIKPFVKTSEYSVNFAKVMEDDGSIVEDLKVLEVCVKPRNPPRQQFTFNDMAYVRRDGSLRAL